ncbi:hypothetical protein M3Y97_00633900 [Aphelenchoides bicaudatus]|nr:hypothetical protein M3Y97_00633900 [Aphelenchoides bicaudatus]
MHDQLREHAEEQNYWIEKLEEDKRSLVKLVEKVPEDTLIRCSNLGDYLIAKQFVIFCSMVLHERVRTLKLTDLRTKFNEVDDFSERQREIIGQTQRYVTKILPSNLFILQTLFLYW